MILFEMLEEIAEKENSDAFRAAFQNRVVFSTMEICLNALKGKHKFSRQYREMKQVLKNPMHRSACKQLRLGQLPMKWRVYYLLVKTRLTLPVFLMTKVIRFIQRKG